MKYLFFIVLEIKMVQIESVLISDAVDSRCADLLKKHGISVTVKTKMPKEELLEEIKV